MAGLTFNVFGNDVSASRTLHRVEGQADQTSSRIGGHFKRMGGIIAGAFAGQAVVSFFKDSLSEATEAQKVGAQTAAVLKSTGGAAHVTADEIGNLATAISKKTGIDDEAIQSGQNMLLTFTDVRNEVGKGNDVFNQATQTLTDMSAATGTDMKKSAIQLGKALNDPIKGVGALARVGVTFTAGQKDQIKHLVETGHKMQAQKIILHELNKEFGGSAEAQATPAMKASVAWGNLKEQIGTYLMPIVQKFSEFLTNTLIPAISNMVDWIARNKDLIVNVGLALLPLLAAWKTYTIVTNIAKTAQIAMNAVMSANPFVRVAMLIGALVVGIVILYKRSATFRHIVQGAFSAVKSAAQTMWGVLRAVFSAIRTAFRAVGSAFAWVWSHGVKPVFGWIRSGIRGVSSVVGAVARGFSRVVAPIVRAFQWVWGWVKKIGGWIGDMIGGVIDGIRTAIDTVKEFIGFSANDFVKKNAGLLKKAGFDVGHNAQGTGFWAGGPTWVGENGPELVTPPRGSQITNASQASSMRGGGGNTYVTVHVSNAGSVLSENDLMASIERAARRGVKARARGAFV